MSGPERVERTEAEGTVTVTERSGTTTTTTVTKRCGCNTRTSITTGPWGSASLSGGSCFRHMPIATLHNPAP